MGGQQKFPGVVTQDSQMPQTEAHQCAERHTGRVKIEALVQQHQRTRDIDVQ